MTLINTKYFPLLSSPLKRLAVKLIILLAVQTVIFIGMIAYNNSQQVASPKKLIDIDFSLVDEFETRDGNTKTLIKKNGGQWIISNYQDLPADSDILQSLFNDLKNIEVVWPIAKTKLAAERFKVTKQTATNTLIFKQGDKILATLYKGTTAEWRTVHVRINEDKNIYTIPIELHRFNSTPINWFDKSILAVKGEIYGVNTQHLSLTKDFNHWKFSDNNDSHIDQNKISHWINYFSMQQVFRLTYNKDEKDSVLSLKPLDTFTFNTSKGDQTFDIYKKGHEIFIQKHGDRHVFKINRKDINYYLNISRNRFI